MKTKRDHTDTTYTVATLVAIGHKRPGFNRVAFLEALVERFVCFEESDVRPRRFQKGRVGGPGGGEGREQFDLNYP